MKTARKYFTITTQLYDQYKENMQENIDKFWDAESKIRELYHVYLVFLNKIF